MHPFSTYPMILLALLGSALLSCRTESGDSGTVPRQDTIRSVPPFGPYDFASKPTSALKLPSGLREVSGIAVSDDGRLFAHNDERGTVYQVDRTTGRMLKQFAVGERRLHEDFEDMAIVGDTFYLVNSKGDLFAFREGADRENVPYVRYQTVLTAKNDVEGLCYDPGSGSLLLACKANPGTDSARTRAVYAFDLGSFTILPAPRFVVSLDELTARFGLKDFRPSGIARHPVSGNFHLISAVGNSIIELSPDGAVLSYASLPKKYHEQPEGIVFEGDGTLLIANEDPRRGKIIVYRGAGK